MDEERLLIAITEAMNRIRANDLHLLANNLSERCIASRLAMYLQERIPQFMVDIEYNRKGDSPKRLQLPDECANGVDDDGAGLVVPDIIVHTRGTNGPNILVLELKKTSNPAPRNCDHQRVVAFRRQLAYDFGGLIECETRRGHAPNLWLAEWINS